MKNRFLNSYRWLLAGLFTVTSAFTGSAMAAEIEQRAPSVRDLSDATSRISEPVQYYGKQIIVQDGDLPTTYNADIEGLVRFPIDGEGPFPVVLYLHGRHVTCEYLGTLEFLGTGECDLEEPRVLGQPIELVDGVDSYKGYDYMAQNLAAHGYIVISIDANDVNAKDLVGDAGVLARSQLILHHLDILREINADGQTTLLQDPYLLSNFRGKIDMSRIGIMGHSRGGQGVTNVLAVNEARPVTRIIDADGSIFGRTFASHSLTAVFALAPTNFDYIDSNGAHFAVLLPYCDGDVSNLQGAFMFDYDRDQNDGFEKFQIMPMGGNHNYYNTIWTSDDYSNTDDWCQESANNTGIDGSSGRSIPKDQRRHGEFMMSSFFRLFVGGEEQFAPFWYGNQSMPIDACPFELEQRMALPEEDPNYLTDEEARLLCDERFHLSIMRTGENRKQINFVKSAENLTTTDLGGSVTLVGEGSTLSFCAATSNDANNGTSDADGCAGSGRLLSTAGNMLLEAAGPAAILQTLSVSETVESMDEEGNPVSETIETATLDATGFDSLTFRIATPIDVEMEADLTVSLIDGNGQLATLRVADFSIVQYLPPGLDGNSEGAKSLFSMVKLPLDAFSGVDKTQLAAFSVATPAPTKIHLTDFMLQNIGNEAPEKMEVVEAVTQQPSAPVVIVPAPVAGSETADSGAEQSTGSEDTIESTTGEESAGAIHWGLLVALFGLLTLGRRRFPVK